MQKYLCLLLISLIPAWSMENDTYPHGVMAPLEPLTDSPKLRMQLQTLKKNSFSLSMDLWWDKIEQEKGEYNWATYAPIINACDEEGIELEAGICFHACGGNVNDTYTSLLPEWIYKEASQEDMFCQNEEGLYNHEYIAPWFQDAYFWYESVFTSFANTFKEHLGKTIKKVNLSLGPSGELRWGSYNRDTFPKRGQFQCYSPAAIKNFRHYVKSQLTSKTYENENRYLHELSQYWGFKLQSIEEIYPPFIPVKGQLPGDHFFYHDLSRKTNYACDFMKWYQGLLHSHAEQMSKIAKKALGNKVNLCAKIAGIHWQSTNPIMRRSAECCAGYYSYESLLDVLKSLDLSMSFTCVELSDRGYHIYTNTGEESYSAARQLTTRLMMLAKHKGLISCGENALPFGLHEDEKFDNIITSFKEFSMEKYLHLRWSDVVNHEGELTNFGKKIVEKLRKDF